MIKIKDVTPEEVIGIVDDTLSCLVNTVLSPVFFHLSKVRHLECHLPGHKKPYYSQNVPVSSFYRSLGLKDIRWLKPCSQICTYTTRTLLKTEH